jgi:WD40 repeat protein
MRVQPYASFAALTFFAALAVVGPWLGAAEEEGPGGVVATLKGHKEAVYAVAFSPDGKFLLTGSGDPAVKIWTAEGKELKSFAGPNAHTKLVVALAVSPDGSQFATGGADNTAKVWDFPTDKHLREFDQGGPATAVAASADGARLAGGGKDGKVKIWNTTENKLLHEISAHTAAVTGLGFSPNGQILVSVSSDSTMRFLNVADGKTLAHFAAHAGPVTGVSYSPGGNAVYTTGDDGTLKFWSLPPVATRSLAAALKEPITALTLTPDGGQIVAASGKSVRLANLANGATVKDLEGASADITAVAASPGSAHVAAATSDRRVVVWENKTGTILTQPVAHGGAVNAAAFNAGGTQLATVGKDGMLRLWAMPPVAPRSLTQPEAVRAAVLSSDGKRLATGSADKMVRLYQVGNLKMPERQLSGHTAAVNAVALSSDNTRAASGGDDEVIRFWGLAKGDQLGQIGAHSGPITSLVFAGNQVLSSSADGSVKLFAAPVAAGKNAFAHADAVTAAALSPDGTRLLTGCADKQVRIWNLSTGQVERSYTGPAMGVLCVAYSPAGNRIAAGSADKTLFVWESATAKEVRKLTGLPAAVQSVALSPDAKHVAGGLADGSVRLYDLITGKEVSSFAAHKKEVTALLFTAKGDQLISADTGGLVQARVIAPKAGAVTEWKHGGGVLSLALNKDNTRIAVGGDDKVVKVHVLATGKEESSITTPAEVRGLSFSPDGKRLAVAGGDGKARIYGTDGVLDEYFSHEGAVNAAIYSGDGKRLFTAGVDKSARVWTPSLVWRAKHEGAVRQSLISPRGDRVISAGADGLVRMFALADGKPLQAIRAHTGGVLGVAISSDSARLATIGADKTARLFDLAKLAAAKTGGKELDAAAVTVALPEAPQSVSLSPNGLRLAVGFPAPKDGKETVRLYDTATGKEVLDLGEGDGLPSHGLHFLADNRTLLAAGADRTARLIDVNLQATFEVHPGGAASVAYHNNGTQILTAGADKTAKLWTIATGKLDRTFGPATEPITAAAFSRDGTQVAALAGKSITVWTTADAKPVLTIELPAAAKGVSFNSDRTRLAVSGGDGRARVYDLATKKELQGFLHAGAVSGVAFHPTTANLLVSGGADKTVGIHTVTAARVIDVGQKLHGLATAPNQTDIFVASGDGKVRVYNAGNGQVTRTLEVSEKPATCVSVARSQLLIAVGSADKKVRLFAFNDTKVLSTFTAPSEPKSLSFSGGSQALAAAGADGSLTLWDVVQTPGQPLPAEFGKVLQTYRHAPEAAGVAFPNVGAVFYSAGADKTVKAWKLASDAPTRNFPHPNIVNALAYNKSGTLLATGCSDGRLRLFDLTKGTVQREIIAHKVQNETSIYCVAFSPDSKQVVTGGMDQTLKVWEVASGKMLAECKAYKEKVFEKGHQAAVYSVDFSPDGKHIVSGSHDQTIKIWKAADGSVVRDLVNPDLKPSGPGEPTPSHPGRVYSVRFFDDGKKIVSVGAAPRLRGYLATWDATTGKRLFGKELSGGTVFALAVSGDGQRLALGTGGSLNSGEEFNQGLVLKTPK